MNPPNSLLPLPSYPPPTPANMKNRHLIMPPSTTPYCYPLLSCSTFSSVLIYGLRDAGSCFSSSSLPHFLASSCDMDSIWMTHPIHWPQDLSDFFSSHELPSLLLSNPHLWPYLGNDPHWQGSFWPFHN